MNFQEINRKLLLVLALRKYALDFHCRVPSAAIRRTRFCGTLASSPKRFSVKEKDKTSLSTPSIRRLPKQASHFYIFLHSERVFCAICIKRTQPSPRIPTWARKLTTLCTQWKPIDFFTLARASLKVETRPQARNQSYCSALYVCTV